MVEHTELLLPADLYSQSSVLLLSVGMENLGLESDVIEMEDGLASQSSARGESLGILTLICKKKYQLIIWNGHIVQFNFRSYCSPSYASNPLSGERSCFFIAFSIYIHISQLNRKCYIHKNKSPMFHKSKHFLPTNAFFPL